MSLRIQRQRRAEQRLGIDRDGFNAFSKWEEKPRIQGLTLWQLNRPIWTAVATPSAVAAGGSSSGGGGGGGGGSSRKIGGSASGGPEAEDSTPLAAALENEQQKEDAVPADAEAALAASEAAPDAKGRTTTTATKASRAQSRQVDAGTVEINSRALSEFKARYKQDSTISPTSAAPPPPLYCP